MTCAQQSRRALYTPDSHTAVRRLHFHLGSPCHPAGFDAQWRVVGSHEESALELDLHQLLELGEVDAPVAVGVGDREHLVDDGRVQLLREGRRQGWASGSA